MFKRKAKLDFKPVAMFLIIVGAVFFTVGLLLILFLLPIGRFVPLSDSVLITIGGALIMGVGYANLELGLIRKQLDK